MKYTFNIVGTWLGYIVGGQCFGVPIWWELYAVVCA